MPVGRQVHDQLTFHQLDPPPVFGARLGDVTRIEDARGEEGRMGLDDLAREGARRMIAAALEAEVDGVRRVV
jgi:hypothetical protein